MKIHQLSRITWTRKLIDQILLEYHKVIGMCRIPADADDVVSHGNGEMDELALMVHALAADVFVAVILGPGLLRFLKLAANAVATNIGYHRSEPVIKHPRLKLKADPEPDRLVIHAGNQGQCVVTPHESAFEEIRLTLGAEHAVVKLHSLRQQLFVGDDDVSLSHFDVP